MTTHIIARFADGKLLIQETKKADQQYYANGIQIRMGHVGHIDKVLSVTTDVDRYGATTPLFMTSAALDVVTVRMYRGDFGSINAASVSETGSGNAHVLPFSGVAAMYTASGLISGLLWYQEVLSGTPVSGLVNLIVNAIGY